MTPPERDPDVTVLLASRETALVGPLTAQGWTVLSAKTIDEGLAFYEQRRPNIVLVAAQLEGASGVDLCRRLKAQTSFNRLAAPLLYLADNDLALVEAALEAGASDWLPPTNPTLLVHRIRRLVQQQRMCLTYDHSMQGLCLIDGSARILMANAVFGQLLDYLPESLFGRSFFDFVWVDDVGELRDAFESLSAHETVTSTVYLRNRGEQLICLDLYLNALPTGAIAISASRAVLSTDIYEIEQKYRHLFNTANDAILIIDALSGRFMDANKQAERLLGYSRDSLLGMRFDEIDFPDASRHSLVDRAMSSSGRFIYEQHYRTRDGQAVPVEISSRLIRLGNRRVFLNIARDLRKREEAEIRERQQRDFAEALRRNAALISASLDLETVLEGILEGVTRVAPVDSANVMIINEGVASIIGRRGYDKRGLDEIRQTIRLKVEEVGGLRWMLRHRKPLLISDTHYYDEWFVADNEKWIRAYLGAPIIAEGEVIGFINLDGEQPNQFTEEHAHNLAAFADQISIAIRNARLHEAIQNYAVDLEQRVEQRTSQLAQANAVLEAEIAERQRAEHTLQAERNLLRTLIDNMYDEVYVKDRELRFILANVPLTTRYQRLHSHQTIIGRAATNLEPPEIAALRHEQEMRVLETGNPVINSEYAILDESGERRLISNIRVPLRDAEGDISGVIGINRDITALRDTEERLRYVVTGANCLLWYASVDLTDDGHLMWRMRVSSEEAAQRFLPVEIEPNEGFVEGWMRSILSEDRERIRATSRNAMLNNLSSYNQEFRCRRSDGEVRWLYEESRVITLTATRWEIIGVCTDITERKHAAEELERAYASLEQRVEARTVELVRANESLKEQIFERHRAEKALSESEARFRALVEHAPEAIVVFDVTTERFVTVNENAVRLFGRSRDDLLKRGPTDFSLPEQADGRPSAEVMRDYIREAVRGEISVFEWTYINVQGQPVPCEVRLLLLPTSDSMLIRGSITDITERKKAQAALQTSEEQYRSLTNQLPIGVYRTNREGVLLYGNPAFSNIMGYQNADQVSGSSMLPFYPNPQDREMLLRESMPDGVRSIEMPLLTRSGELIWVRDTWRAILDEDGQIHYIDGSIEQGNRFKLVRVIEIKRSHQARHDTAFV